MYNEILINQIQTPDGTIIRSFNTHDFRTHKDKNGRSYSVDGGLSYLRRVGKNDYRELSVLTHDSFEKIRLYWEVLIDKPLCDMTTLEIWDCCERLSYWDKFYDTVTNKNEKEYHVINTSLILQERYFRSKYKNYCKQVRRLVTLYKKQQGTDFDIGKLLASKISEVEKPFGEITKIHEASKNGVPIYHKLVCLVKEWMDKHSFAKISEFETERVLKFILKPLEERNV